MIAVLVDELVRELITHNAIWYENASQLLITAGDNPQRLRLESDFAALCGVSPVPVSSGKTNRYRLNRGEIVLQIVYFTSLPSDICELTIKRRHMSLGE